MADDKRSKAEKAPIQIGQASEGLSIEGILGRRDRRRELDSAPEASDAPAPGTKAETPGARFSLKAVIDLIANEARTPAPVAPPAPAPVAEPPKAPEKAADKPTEKQSADARRKIAAQERRWAREFSLQLLYAARLSESSVELAEARLLGHAMQEGWDDETVLHVPSPVLRSFSRQLALRAIESTVRYNEMLAQRLTNWRIERLETIDQMLLHLAVAELELFPDTSHRIVLNEFIEIAKDFGSDQSPRFINGVLDALIPTVRPGVQSKGRAGSPSDRDAKKNAKKGDGPKKEAGDSATS